MTDNWLITMKAPWGGLVPSYYDSSLFYGANNQFSVISQSVNLLNPDYLTQGKGSTPLTNGTQAGNVPVSVAHFSNPTATGKIYAVGENKAIPITATTVGSAIDINTGGSESATACVVAGAYAYVFFSKGTSGEIARITVSDETIDPDWGSTVPATGAAALQGSVKFQAILAKGAGKIFFTNGRYVGFYDYINDILNVTALDFQADSKCVDLVWEKDYLFIAVNNPNISLINSQGRIYTWDTFSQSFQEPIIEVGGKLGGLLSDSGRIYCFYDKIVDIRFSLGIVNGDTVQEISSFSGSLPTFGGYIKWNNHILFKSGNNIMAYGAVNNTIPVALYKLFYTSYTIGAIGYSMSNPFIASSRGTSYKIAQMTGYASGGNIITKWFDVATSVIEKIVFHYRTLDANARVDVGLRYEAENEAVTILDLGDIQYTYEANTRHKTFLVNKERVENFAIYLDFTFSDTTNPIQITQIDVYGKKSQSL